MKLLKPSDEAPRFTLPNQEGKMINLADLLSQYVVIYFYPKALTPGCTVQACQLRDGAQELAKRGAIAVGISADAPSRLKKFVEKEGLNFALLGDPEHKTLEKYGVWQQKSMYGRSYWGVARVTYILNPKGFIAHVLTNVNPKTHLSEVLDWFDAQK